MTLVLTIVRNEALQTDRRLAALEQRTEGFKYCDVWQERRQYEVGNFVTHGGSLWHCNRPTSRRPGDGTKDWTLAIKCGRDGR